MNKGVVIGCLVVLFLLLGCETISDKKLSPPSDRQAPLPTIDNPSFEERIPERFSETPKPPVGLPSCGEKKELFFVPPLQFSDFTGVVPLGNLAPSAHVFPTAHLFFELRRTNPNDGSSLPAEVPVFAPSDMAITMISSTTTSSKQEFDDYALYFYPCAEVYAYLDHLVTLSSTLQKAHDAAPADNCEQYTLRYGTTVGSVDWTFCKKEVNIQVKKGEQLGTAGKGAGQRRFDFATFDTRISPHQFANPQRWTGLREGYIPYTVCPFDYYPADIQHQLKTYLGVISGNKPRTIEPVCGEVAQDKLGTAQGNWVTPDTGLVGPEDKYLALVHDSLDPRVPVFSVGTSIPTIPYSEYRFTPEAEGLVNRDFSQVIPEKVHCYDGLKNRENSVSPIILLQLKDQETLLIEGQQKTSCGSGPWELKQPTMFIR